MADWPLKHDGPCACRFVRKEEFGECEQVEWCGLHAKQRDEDKALRADAERYRWLRKRGGGSWYLASPKGGPSRRATGEYFDALVDAEMAESPNV